MAQHIKEHPFSTAAAATSIFDGVGLIGEAPELADAAKFIWDTVLFIGRKGD
jgi:hypothetical protein